MSHVNARLTPAGPLIMVQRIQSGRAVAHVAAEMGSRGRRRGGGGAGSVNSGWWGFRIVRVLPGRIRNGQALEATADHASPDPPIVLLDEVTSALDPTSDAAVHRGIDRLCKGRTVVMVAHRMHSVRTADQIVFLDNGHIIEQGTHIELMQLNGRYADYWKISHPTEAT